MSKRVLFIDRDGTIVKEPPVDYQLDSLEKLEFIPKVIRSLYFIRKHTDLELVMVSNQDGLGTDSFPEETFWPAHNLILKTLAGEGIEFDFPEENSPNRKPRVGMLTKYLEGDYDLANSYVVGDRLTDIELAANLGAKGIWLRQPDGSGEELAAYHRPLSPDLVTDDWDRHQGNRYRDPGQPRRIGENDDLDRAGLFRPYARADRQAFGDGLEDLGQGRP